MDTLTVGVMAILVSVVNAFAVSLAALIYRSERAMKLWTISAALFPLATFFLISRSFAPLLVSVIVGNALYASAIWFSVLGLRCFFKQRLQWKAELVAIVAILVLLVVFTLVYESYRIRVAVYALLLAYLAWQGILAAQAPLKQRYTLPRRLFLTAYSILFLNYLIRFVLSLVDQVSSGLVTNGLANAIAFLIPMIVTWLYSYSMILMPGLKERYQLSDAMETDELTQVANRRALFARYNHRTSIQNDKLVVLIMFDIDHFKKVNDTQGHLMGDLVLKELAQYVRENLRTSDIFCRLGGEEFAILSQVRNEDQAFHYADMLRSGVQKYFIGLQASGMPAITISVGIATSPVRVPLESLLFVADHYLYKAKANGRNRCEIASSTN